jgi:hypothetical protein
VLVKIKPQGIANVPDNCGPIGAGVSFIRRAQALAGSDPEIFKVVKTRGFLKMFIQEHGNRILGFTASCF